MVGDGICLCQTLNSLHQMSAASLASILPLMQGTPWPPEQRAREVVAPGTTKWRFITPYW